MAALDNNFLSISDYFINQASEKLPQQGTSGKLLGPAVLDSLSLVGNVRAQATGILASANMIQGQRDLVGMAALGVTTWFNIPAGLAGASDAYKDASLAAKVGEVGGKVLGALRCVRSSALALGGLFFVPARILALATYFNSSPSVALAGTLLERVGTSVFIGVFALSGLINALSLSKAVPFFQGLRKELSDPMRPPVERPLAILQRLQGELKLTAEERQSIRQEVERAPHLSAQMRAALIVQKEQDLSIKKGLPLTRFASAALVESIKNATAVQAPAIIEELYTQVKRKIILNAIGLVLFALGIATAVIPLVAVAGTSLVIAAAILSSFVTLGWIVLDSYSLYQMFKTGAQDGIYDTAAILISTVVCLLATTLAAVLSAGIVPMAVAIGVGTVWLIINVLYYLRFKKRNI